MAVPFIPGRNRQPCRLHWPLLQLTCRCQRQCRGMQRLGRPPCGSNCCCLQQRPSVVAASQRLLPGKGKATLYAPLLSAELCSCSASQLSHITHDCHYMLPVCPSQLHLYSFGDSPACCSNELPHTLYLAVVWSCIISCHMCPTTFGCHLSYLHAATPTVDCFLAG